MTQEFDSLCEELEMKDTGSLKIHLYIWKLQLSFAVSWCIFCHERQLLRVGCVCCIGSGGKLSFDVSDTHCTCVCVCEWVCVCVCVRACAWEREETVCV